MKKSTLYLKTIIVLVTVITTLSFEERRLFLGSIYCFNNAFVPYVNTNTYCDAGIQPHSTKIDYEISFSSFDPTTNPCSFGYSPFDGSYFGQCRQTTPGFDHYRMTQAIN